jgi:hypothetical protein
VRTKSLRLKRTKTKAKVASDIERTADERRRKVTIMSVNVRPLWEEGDRN